jgi:hypothetical protein
MEHQLGHDQGLDLDSVVVVNIGEKELRTENGGYQTIIVISKLIIQW